MGNPSFAVSVKDDDGAYIRANDAFLTQLGIEASQLSRVRDEQLHPRGVLPDLAANDRAALESSGPLLVEEQIFDRLGRRSVAACRFTTLEDDRTLLWRVSGPPEQAATVAAEAERLRTRTRELWEAVAETPAPARAATPTAAAVPSPPDPAPRLDRERLLERAAAFEEARAQIARLEVALARARTQPSVHDERGIRALETLAEVAEALEEPLTVEAALRVTSERLALGLGFDAAVGWRMGRFAQLTCSSVWSAAGVVDEFETTCWRGRRALPTELSWGPASNRADMRTLVDLPVAGVGAIELLTRDAREPEAETIRALRAAASQLVLMQRLSELAEQPRWAFPVHA